MALSTHLEAEVDRIARACVCEGVAAALRLALKERDLGAIPAAGVHIEQYNARLLGRQR